MPAANRNDPFGSFNFMVEIDGVMKRSCSEVFGLDAEIEPVARETISLSARFPASKSSAKFRTSAG